MKGRETLMRSHLRRMAKRKVSDFLLREEGMVGNRSAFATAALVSTTALAMTLLVSPDTEAHLCPNIPGPENCGPHGTCIYCIPGTICGVMPGNQWYCFNP